MNATVRADVNHKAGKKLQHISQILEKRQSRKIQ